MEQTVRKERKLLKRIVKKYKKKNEPFISMQELNTDRNNYYLHQLSVKKFISLSFGGETNSRQPNYIHVNETAIHFFEIRFDENIEFIKRSILAPIIVSVITTGIMWIIAWLSGSLR